MTRDRTPRRGGRAAGRGQTLHDYVAGISVFVLTIAVVLGLLPGVLAPYQSGGSTADVTKAERIGDRLVSNLSSPSSPNVLDVETLSTVMTKTDADLRERYGLPDYQHVNVTVTRMNGSGVVTNASDYLLTTGAGAYGNEVATSARIVAMSERIDDCRPACRLVVRVW